VTLHRILLKMLADKLTESSRTVTDFYKIFTFCFMLCKFKSFSFIV